MKELSVDGLNVVIELYSRKKEVLARDIAVEIDMSSSRVGRVCKKLAEDGIIDRSKKGNIYWYKLTEYGMQYCSQD